MRVLLSAWGGDREEMAAAPMSSLTLAREWQIYYIAQQIVDRFPATPTGTISGRRQQWRNPSRQLRRPPNAFGDGAAMVEGGGVNREEHLEFIRHQVQLLHARVVSIRERNNNLTRQVDSLRDHQARLDNVFGDLVSKILAASLVTVGLGGLTGCAVFFLKRRPRELATQSAAGAA